MNSIVTAITDTVTVINSNVSFPTNYSSGNKTSATTTTTTTVAAVAVIVVTKSMK